MIGDLILACIENNETPQPMGNELPGLAIHSAFPCRGEEEWIAIAISGEEDWQSLLAVMDRPDLADDIRFKDVEARLQHRAELKKIIADWTASQEKRQLADVLQGRGIAAAPVNSGKDVASDPQLHATGFFSEISHPDAGKRPYQGLPFAFSRSHLPPLRHAPLLGEHTERVLREWGQIDETAIAALLQSGTVSN
jgi:crotonobetainyl-CoA:carnitine CoA-transferase CaiB-like acyl-CoA transferase